MSNPKKAPAPKAVGSATEAALEATAAASDPDNSEDTSVTSTGRVKVETKIKVEDFSEGGETPPDVYGREADVEKSVRVNANGRKVVIESFI